MLGKIARKTVKPTLYVSLIASMLWVAVDLADGASDRFHMRVGQVKTQVAEPADAVTNTVTEQATKLWASIESNPGPSILALVLFAATVLYHKYKGRTLMTALKAGILKEAPVDPKEPENPLVAKMQREILEGQMLDTYEKLEARQKVLPEDIKNAAQGVKQTELNRRRAEAAATHAIQEHVKAQAYLTRLEKEFNDGLATLVELEAELNKA